MSWADSLLRLQVVANYVAMTPDGRVVDSSLDKGRPYDLRIGAGQVNGHLALCLTGAGSNQVCWPRSG